MPVATHPSPDVQTTTKTNPLVNTPEFVQRIQADFVAQNSHTFIVHGNIFDYMDPNGNRLFLLDVLGAQFDTNIKKINAAQAKALMGITVEIPDKKTAILAYFTADLGLQFLSEASGDAWRKFMLSMYKEEELMAMNVSLRPVEFTATMDTLNAFFQAAKKRAQENKGKREAAKLAGRNPNTVPLDEELNFTMVFIDSQFALPSGEVAHMDADRRYLAMFRAWSRDLMLGNRSKIILATPNLAELHEAIRGSDSYVTTIAVRKPNLAERRSWLTKYNEQLKAQASAGNPQIIGGNPWGSIELPENETLEDIAIQSAGMNFKQLEGPLISSRIEGKPLTVNLVRSVKQEILRTEYGGVIEFVEPIVGFDNIGGHEHLKRYGIERIKNPLRVGDKDTCSAGVILAGPGGTGKTEWASALAYECGVNFIIAHLDKLKNKYVGDSEKLMAKFIDAVKAAAPCVLFIDEMDSVWGKNIREGSGDSGVATGQFNSFMQFASDPSRRGQIVLVGASNRPDLLDAALIRPGRFDDVLPALPPRPDDWQGKMAILFAIMNRKKLKFAKDLEFNPLTGPEMNVGLGKLAHDKRFWTGAEINKLIEDALLNAKLAETERKKQPKYQFRITAEDWNASFKHVLPKTGDMNRMIGLALYMMNNLRYCPPGWEEEALKVQQIQQNQLDKTLSTDYRAGTYIDDRE